MIDTNNAELVAVLQEKSEHYGWLAANVNPDMGGYLLLELCRRVDRLDQIQEKIHELDPTLAVWISPLMKSYQTIRSLAEAILKRP